jgi:hypothetical protein
MLQLVDAFAGHGYQASMASHGRIRVIVPIEYGEVGAELEALLGLEGEAIVVDLVVPVLGSNLEAIRGPTLLGDLSSDVQCILDQDSDDLHIVAAGARSEPLADVALALVQDACRALGMLLHEGTIDVSDAAEDDTVNELLRRLPESKENDPRKAVALAVEGAGRCRSLGNPSLGSFLEIAAAEILIDLGEISRASELAEPAWVQLGAPTGWREAVTVVAHLRARQGHLSEAIGLMEDALRQQDDAFDAAVVRGDLGVLLAEAGRWVEASRLLSAAASDERLDEHHRAHFGEQLRILRSGGTDPLGPGAATDARDTVDAKLNEIASLLLGSDIEELIAVRWRLDRLVDEVMAEVDRLGPAQRARVAMAQGYLAHVDGHGVLARQHLDRAVQISEGSGDVELARWVRNQSASLLNPGASDAEAGSTPIERLAVLLNRALAELPADVRRAHATTLQAIELVDLERHQYVNEADRAAWARLAARVYELGLVSSVAMRDDAEVIEILERVRAQGVPASQPHDASSTPPPETDKGPDLNGGLPAHLLDLLRETVGDRPVARPVVASIRRSGPSTNAVIRSDLETVSASVAGGPAWWWASHVYGERIYWAVRSPEGQTWAGANVLEGGRSAVDDLTLPFRSVTSEADLVVHPLLGDEDHRLVGLLEAVARAMLPAPVVAAARNAIRDAEPIRLVWAPSPALARVPLSLLPIDDALLLDAAAVVTAPPTSLALAGTPSRVRDEGERPILLLLGGDPDLGLLSELARSISPDPDQVLGAVRHMRAGLVGSLATPNAVVDALRSNGDAVAVYFGHIDEEGPSSRSAALSLTDGVNRATLDASSMLTPERNGSPHAVVLAGCSSLSASHIGGGEWWGLATALLWQGSKHVVGSIWDVLPTTATQEFVADIADALRRSDDSPMALRQVQLQHRERWTRTGTSRPYEWAGWSIISSDSSP